MQYFCTHKHVALWNTQGPQTGFMLGHVALPKPYMCVMLPLFCLTVAADLQCFLSSQAMARFLQASDPISLFWCSPRSTADSQGKESCSGNQRPGQAKRVPCWQACDCQESAKVKAEASSRQQWSRQDRCIAYQQQWRKQSWCASQWEIWGTSQWESWGTSQWESWGGTQGTSPCS